MHRAKKLATVNEKKRFRGFESFKVFSCLKKDNPRILSTFERSFSKRAGKTSSSNIIHSLGGEYLTILPRARMGFESIARDEEARIDY